MQIIQNGYSCENDIKIFAKLFFDELENVFITSNFVHKENVVNVYTSIMVDDKQVFEDYYFPFENDCSDKKMLKKVYVSCCTKSFCHAAQKFRCVNLPWGVMSGIRPAKSVREFIEYGYSYEQIKEILKQIYEIRDSKIDLAIEVAKNEKILLSQIGENSVSIYIGIPFCPTRCLYCSFVSTDIRVSGKYMDDYVNLLLKEIEKTKEVMNKIGVWAENIYIGGGTPTTLSAEHLKMIFDKLSDCFDMSKIKEFTLEAGRPDTITREKLIVAKHAMVNRISINPQSMNDKTLKKVRRTHSPQMIRDTYLLAKEIGFNTINMDLIAGLPDETVEMYKYSLDEVIKLSPENITVHSMCVKRSASLKLIDLALTEASKMNEMLDYTQKRMKENGMEPYYMYRQKNISGNLENVGYSKKGHMSEYNINIMEELQTIIALGGGGSTKIVIGDRIERIFNFKDPYEYIRRFDEILKKKDEIIEILESEMK